MRICLHRLRSRCYPYTPPRRDRRFRSRPFFFAIPFRFRPSSDSGAGLVAVAAAPSAAAAALAAAAAAPPGASAAALVAAAVAPPGVVAAALVAAAAVDLRGNIAFLHGFWTIAFLLSGAVAVAFRG